MGLFKAVVKTFFEAVNQHIYDNEVKNAKNTAVKKTRTEVAKCKQKGKPIDAKQVYCKKFYPALKKAKYRKDLRSTLISNV